MKSCGGEERGEREREREREKTESNHKKLEHFVNVHQITLNKKNKKKRHT